MLVRLGQRLGKPEIRQLDGADVRHQPRLRQILCTRNHQVARLEVPVHDRSLLARVQVGQTPRGVRRDLERAPGRKTHPGPHRVCETASAHQLRHQNVGLLLRACAQELDRVRVVHFPQHLDLRPEVAQGDVRRRLEHFCRDGRAVPQRSVDDAELALSELGAELERRGLDLPVGVEGEAWGREVGDAGERRGAEGDELFVCVMVGDDGALWGKMVSFFSSVTLSFGLPSPTPSPPRSLSLILTNLPALLDLPALVDQQLRHLGKVPSHGLLERRPPEPVDGVDGRPLLEQPLCHFIAPFGGREVERGALVVVAAGGLGDLRVGGGEFRGDGGGRGRVCV